MEVQEEGVEEDEEEAQKGFSSTQKELVKMYHQNLGHPQTRDFLRILNGARATAAVLQYVKEEFRRPDCDATQKVRPPRRAAIPRIYEFNQVVAMDTVLLKMRGRVHFALNIACCGTNYQVMTLTGDKTAPTAEATWKAFNKHLAPLLHHPGLNLD